MSGTELSPRPLRETARDRRLFVDRELELDLCRRFLLSGGNVLLLGRRGIGKSSFLRSLAAVLRERGQDAAVVDGRAGRGTRALLALTRSAPAVDAAASAGAPPPGPNETQLLIDELRAMKQVLEGR